MKPSRRWLILGLLTWLPLAQAAWALIMVGGRGPVQGRNWPDGAEAVANLPTRFAYWEGPPFGGGNYHFEYVGSTEEFQTALDAFASIQAPRLDVMLLDGATTSTFSHRHLDWEFEVWDRESYTRLNQPSGKITMSDSPWFGRPLPAPLLTVFLGEDPQSTPVDWSRVRVPANVTVLDRRVASSLYADSRGGVVRATIHDMATSQPLAGVTLEIGRFVERVFQADTLAISGPEGVAVVRDLPPGNYVLYARRSGYATRQLGSYRNYGHTLGLFDDARLAPAASLRGRVTDAAGKPIAGATVGLMGLAGLDGAGYNQNLYNEQTTVQTDADGRFALEQLPQGRACLRVRKPGYYFFSFDIHPVPGGDVSIAMTLSGAIRGRVEGQPAGGMPEGYRAYVSLQPVGDPVGRWAGERPCADDGTFQFEGIPADSYTLTPFLARSETSGFNRNERTPAFPPREITLKEGGAPLEVVLDLNKGR